MSGKKWISGWELLQHQNALGYGLCFHLAIEKRLLLPYKLLLCVLREAVCDSMKLSVNC